MATKSAKKSDRFREVREKIGKEKMSKLIRGETIKFNGNYYRINEQGYLIKV